MHQSFLLDLTNPICALCLSFALVLHLCNHTDSLTQHQPCHTTALIFFQPSSKDLLFHRLFFFFTLLSLDFLSLLFSLFYHLRVQLPAPCFGSLSILTCLFLPEGIPVTTPIFLLQINSFLSPISSSAS